jgi:hypothetical protein
LGDRAAPAKTVSTCAVFGIDQNININLNCALWVLGEEKRKLKV